MAEDMIAKLEAAHEGNASLDLALWRFVSGEDWYWQDRNRETITVDRYEPGASGNPVVSLDRWTRSIDVAARFIERLRPGSEWAISTLHDLCHAEVDMNAEEPVTARGNSLPLAMCIAALRAARAQGERD